MDRITLRNMRVFTHVGCTTEERRVGQHLELDVEFHMDLRKPGTTDRIGDSIDYAHSRRSRSARRMPSWAWARPPSWCA
jgi:7,8-dihydroneopterin aldolase/epimerase/oxygenase